MREPSSEALFERWRSAGDLDAMAAVFDRTAPGLLGLAAHLARDPAEAEDLVQATFCAALEHARAFDPSRRLEPWLAGILVRLARRARRERARTPDPRRLEREPAAEPPVELERRELDAALARALDDLEEPYRGVLARHLSGERALDIARSSGRAPGTVRMQILRGLERLRRLLPAGLYAAAPLGDAHGLDALRAAVLEQARSPAALGTAAPTGWIGGVTTMTTAAKAAGIAAAAALLGLALYSARAQGARPDDGGEARVAPRPPSVAVAATEGERVQDEPTAPAAEAAPANVREDARDEDPPAPEPAREASRIWLAGALLALPFEPDAATVRVTTPTGWSTEAPGSADGTYRIEVTPFVRGEWGDAPAETLLVFGEHPSGRRARLELALAGAERRATDDGDETIEAPLAFAPATAVIGRVRGEGLDFAAVRLALVPPHGSHEECSADGACDQQGRFALFPPCAGPLRLVAVAPGVLPLCVEVDVAEGVATDVGALALDQRGVAIEGRIESSLEPLVTSRSLFAVRARRRFAAGAGSKVQVFEVVDLTAEGARVLEGVAGVRVDGTFRIDGLEPGEYRLELDAGQSTYLVPAFPSAEVVAPIDGVLLGEHYGLVEVALTGLEPGANASVFVCTKRQSYRRAQETRGEPVLAIADRRAALEIAATGSEGGRVERESAAGTRSELERVELDLGGAAPALEVTWIQDGAAPPESVRALWSSAASSGDVSGRMRTGGCTLPDLPPGLTRVSFEAGRDSLGRPPASLCVPSFEVEIVAGRTTRVDVAWVPAGSARVVPSAREGAPRFLRARVLDSAGTDLPVRFARREMRDDGPRNSSYGNSVPLDSPTELEPLLPPGAYTLVLSESKVELLRVPFVIVAGETVDVRFVAP